MPLTGCLAHFRMLTSNPIQYERAPQSEQAFLSEEVLLSGQVPPNEQVLQSGQALQNEQVPLKVLLPRARSRTRCRTLTSTQIWSEAPPSEHHDQIDCQRLTSYRLHVLIRRWELSSAGW